MGERESVIHTIEPVFSPDSRLLILGSFPSVISRQEGFYYANRRNRFWPIMESLFSVSLPDAEARKDFLLSNGIALWDVIAQCSIVSSSDAEIRDAIPNDIPSLIEKTRINAVAANGRKAYELYSRLIKDKTGIDAICLPSTSPANAGSSFESLLEAWSIIRSIVSFPL